MTSAIGVVVIGRNEGERLRVCLESLRGAPVVYVDSGSTDGSVELARAMGAEVVALDMSRPFSAARGRNAGCEALQRREVTAEYVQFVDGDCEVAAGWLDAAREYLDAHGDVAAVTGALRERFPEASIYNRMCDMEWRGPVGEIAECGGVAMYRRAAFAAVGGFDGAIHAGEEPELCLRLREKGWKIARIDDAMARHDAALLRFGPWWRRVVRGGEAAMDISARTGARVQVFAAMLRRAMLWGVLLPLGGVAMSVLAATALGPAWSVACAGACAALYVLQAARFARRGMRAGLRRADAAAYGALCALVKFGEAWGAARWRLRQRINAAGRAYEKAPEVVSAAR